MLDPRPDFANRCSIDVGHHLHRVRVAHRHRTDAEYVTVHLELISQRLCVGKERDIGRQKFRRAHVDRH